MKTIGIRAQPGMPAGTAMMASDQDIETAKQALSAGEPIPKDVPDRIHVLTNVVERRGDRRRVSYHHSQAYCLWIAKRENSDAR